ncbi:hypothetical protein PHJA_002920900 [Phtheirospermum japonicum]|uniref:Uncharacterized protein n=1 Tax=Phtheirospermum japonicum TaxID=374723 RepID=A0A830DDJ1_9LAMI|nr:hypothetical protein PHJA_002920900 [Phtheirospermum japonicum]
MASLTPGTLDKLLQNVGNQDFKVISIVPSLEDDPWKSRGYFLRVSDSLHSAYVSVSDEDVELILNDKIQLGQFIHVARLDSCSPVPVLKGLKPIPKRRPCVGDPKDLISSDFLSAKKVEVKVKSKSKLKKVVENAEESVRRLSLGNGKVGGFESRRLSFDSARRGWDTSPRSENGSRGAKEKSKDKFSSVISNKVFPHDSPTLSSISVSPLKNKNVIISPKHVPKPTAKNLKTSDDDVIFPSDFNKVAISSKNSPDSAMLWNSLPPAICELGKETRSFRNVAFASAVHALEEASIYECVLRCMSTFAELCELSQNNSSDPLVEQFMNLHESMTKAAKVIIYLKNVKTSNPNETKDFSSQTSASLWVQAAVETDLSKFALYTKGGQNGNNNTNPEKRHYVVLENNTTPEKIDSPQEKKKPVNVAHSKRHLSNAKVTNGGRCEKWSVGSGLRNADILLRKLISSSRALFLDYLEDCLNNGFGVKNRDDASNVAVLGQLKRVNRWLDEAFNGGDSVDERITEVEKEDL